MTQKIKLRRHFRQIRDLISPFRRKEAPSKLWIYLQKEIKEDRVLSFSSFGSEISTLELNFQLLKKKTLFLPRVHGDCLEIYHVKDLSSDLVPSRLGPLEPNPERCEKISLEEIELALIPGLAFDLAHHRLGYGKGLYDRLLRGLHCKKLGVGFSEQQSQLLPKDDWDIPLSEVLYF